MSFRSNIRRLAALGLAPVLSLSVLSACGNDPAGAAAECNGLPEQPTITFAAYSTPREVYGKIISAFQEKWKDEHDDQSVIFQESYGGSTTQSQNVVNGFEADVVACRWVPTSTSSRTPGSSPTTGPPERRRDGLDLDRGLRRPAGQPRGHRGLGRPCSRRHGGPDARPRIKRWRTVEHRRRLRSGDARLRRRGEGDKAGAKNC